MSFITEIIRVLLSFVFLPIVLPIQLLRSNKSLPLKILGFIASLYILLPLWIIMGFLLFLATTKALVYTGIVQIAIPTMGPSMLPTLSETDTLSLHVYAETPLGKPEIKKGDIVVFKNKKTDESLQKQHKDKGSFVKRVIGTTGDKIVIRDGFVYVNGVLAKEPYTLKSRSTFGGDFLKDCQEITVPKGKILVMGDNRKRSEDSRHIGLVNLSDISYYLPYSEQKLFTSRWRDTNLDKYHANTSTLSIEEYIRLLNKKRLEQGIPPLKFEPKLADSAKRRAQVMLEYNDFSYEATKSAYTMRKAIRDSGYSNILYGEFPMLGYYDAQELVDSFFELPKAKAFLLEKDYQDIGISTFIGQLNGCPVQIVVQHLGGYVPPNYTSEDIEFWKTVLSQLREIQPGWVRLRDSGVFYTENKKDIDRINEIIRTRIDHVEAIVSRMQKNEWLTSAEEAFIKEEPILAKEQNELSKKLNSL